jgi:hypothetical protein
VTDARPRVQDSHSKVVMSEANEFTIKVPSDDPKRKDQGDDKVEKKDGLNKGKGDANEAEGEEMVCTILR